MSGMYRLRKVSLIANYSSEKSLKVIRMKHKFIGKFPTKTMSGLSPDVWAAERTGADDDRRVCSVAF